MNPTTPASSGSTALGCVIGFGLSVALVVVLVLFVPTVMFMFGGLVQLVYIIPLVMHFRKRGQTRTITGLIISAGLTLLITAACGSVMR